MDHDFISSVSCSPNNAYYSSAKESKTVSIRKIIDGSVELEIHSQSGNIRSLAFDSSSKYLALGTFSGHVEVWDIQNRKRLKVIASALSGQINDIEFSSDGKYLAVTGGNYKPGVKVFDMKNFTEMYYIKEDTTHNSIKISHDSDILAVGTSNGLSLYKLDTGHLLKKIDTGDIFKVDFSHDGKFIAFNGFVNSYKYAAVVWNIKLNKIEYAISDGIGILGAVFTPDDSILSVASNDGVLRQFDADKRKWLGYVASPGGSIKSIENCGNQYVVTGHWYDTVNVIDILSNKVIRTHQ